MSKRKNKKAAPLLDNEFGSDERFQFIAGYTEGGAPYGITWEAVQQEEKTNEGNPVNLSDLVAMLNPRGFDAADRSNNWAIASQGTGPKK